MGRHLAHVVTKEVSNPEHSLALAGQSRATKHHCPFCTLSWTKLGDYNRHLATHNGAKPYACKHKGCKKSFSQKTALITHCNTHTGARPHRCRHPGCTSAFGDPSSRTRHEKETHNPANGYKCRKCGNVAKRREQFRRHYKECFKKDPTEGQFADAKDHCAKSYAERLVKEEVMEEALAPPPKRKRRGAIVTLSAPEEEDEDEDDMAERQTLPKYEPSYTGDYSSESTVTSSPNFYRASEEPMSGPTFGDVFEPAYTPTPASKYYTQPPPQYTAHYSSSPGHPFNLPRVNSPGYDMHTMDEHMIGSLYERSRLPTNESTFSALQSPPGHMESYSVSTLHLSSSGGNPSPHLTVSTPPLLMPVATRHAIMFNHLHDSPPLKYLQDQYGDISPVDRIPRGGFNGGHPQVQSRLHLHQHRHQPYARDHRGGPSASDHFDVYTTCPGLPMMDSSYGGHASDLDSDPMPPLSLAGTRMIKPMMESYDSTVPF